MSARTTRRPSGVLLPLGDAFAARLARVRGDQSDRGAAIIAVLTFMILLLGLTLALASALSAQPKSIYTAERGTKVVYASQAGLQVGLGQLRAAKGTTYGDKTELPCSLSGSVDGTSASATYTVTIKYFGDGFDPTGRDQDTAWISANALSCNALTGVASTPSYALLTSTGKAASIPGLSDTVGLRTVIGVYVFRVTNINIPGGLIDNLGDGYCMVAESNPPVAGSKIRFRPITNSDCANLTIASWVYDTDYAIKLASSLSSATPLCITDPNTLSPGTATREAVLQLCNTASVLLRWKQLWSWQGSYSWSGQNVLYATGNSSTCLAPEDTTWASKRLLVRPSNCSGQFSPTSAVGAGAAGKATNQVVNYQEFGRCLDVTNEDINTSFLIAYPCKQDPSGTGSPAGTGFLAWNHKFYYDEPTSGSTSAAQDIYVSTANTPLVVATRRCLTSPTSTTAPVYPSFDVCSSSNVRQDWKRVKDTGSYDGSYLLTDNLGRCLAVDATNTYSGWSKVVVETCNGGLDQKWNAPAGNNAGSFGSYKELQG